jgi:hypothetical protein
MPMARRAIYMAFSAALLAAQILAYIFQPGGKEALAWISDLFPVLFGAVAVAGMWSGVSCFKTTDKTKIAWILLLAGVILNAAAEVAYAGIELLAGLDMNEIFPSLADLFWISGYVPLLIGLLILMTGYRASGLPMGSWIKYALTALFLSAVAAVVVIWVIVPIASDPEAGFLSMFVSAYYPIADIVLLAPALALILVGLQFQNGRIIAPWILLTAAFIFWCFSDILYSILVWQDLYGSGNYIDLGWSVSYLLLGAAGLTQRGLMRSI